MCPVKSQGGLRALIVAACSFILFACATPAPTRGTREVVAQGQGQGVTEAELQQDVQRFVSEFQASISQSMEPLLNSSDRNVAALATKQMLNSLSSVLEIATGPSPGVNLLDLLVFVRLNKDVVEDYWITNVYGEQGLPLRETLLRLEEELWHIAGKVMNESQKENLIAIIERWRERNPEQVHVEGVRLSEFSRFFAMAEEAEAREAVGLLSNVKSAVSAADAGILLAERALFMVQRWPFLLRLQARVASTEITSEVASQISATDNLINDVRELRPVVHDLSLLTNRATQLTQQSRMLAGEIDELVPEKSEGKVLELVTRIENSLGTAERLLRETKAIATGRQADPFATVLTGIDRLMRKGIFYLVLLGASWAFFGWGGYYLAKGRFNKRS